ncbi:DegQ family serine endoprotease [Pseudahrensia aquimaris]|uniref:DegQ family serine endoprotease n=1 Tax=Pseudahrensia aquimaris TaxID=744461 RepID=A0ABW3FJP1_9HYPH
MKFTLRLFSFIVIATAAAGSVLASAQSTKLVPQSAEQIRFSYAPLVKKIAPAVVNVYAARQVRQRRSPFAGDPFFEQFFGRSFGQPRQRTERSLGSGVIVGGNGLVVTNNHVIEGADEVKIALSDGREFAADIVLIDKRSDLAVLRVQEPEDFPTVPLGNPDELEVGDLVLAIGNPFGVGQTVTSGIVSALARSQGGVDDFGFFIQTDASINPGNSGGALVNMQGELIGINTSIFTRSGGSNGIGFAVPSDMVRVVLESVNLGSSTLLRPWVGADFQAVTPDISESLGMDRPRGALVAGVAKGGPAEAAGMRLGDIVLELDGNPVEHINALGYRLATAGLDRTVDVKVLSQDQEKTLQIRLQVAPEDPPRDLLKLTGRSPFAGAEIANISPRVASELEMRASLTGVVIMNVERGSPAQRIGLRPKDILLEVNEERVSNTRQMQKLSQARFRAWKFTIDRDGRQFTRVLR